MHPIRLISFGYLHLPTGPDGSPVPPTADRIEDVRHRLRDPAAARDILDLDGLNPSVQDVVLNTPGARELLANLADYADLPAGPRRIAIGCAGGRHAEQWLPASAEAFIWIRLYQSEGTPLDPQVPLWWTLRRRDHGSGLIYQPMNYEALRAVFRRANALLETNWSMHDLRHTAALRMARDKRLSLRDVQTILGHAHLSTTADIYLVEDEEQVIARVQEYLADVKERATLPPPSPATGYEASDLDVLFGGELA
ncbi:tyrosine-type recombinase/integrase [Streptomyces sp. BE133]|uniref:tyrosine-type recombinase/integrase n=1 Tax=Streptomyces sp. BE133 TaxID=3002523 RepID=UPI002E79B007|nr:tyrosine-type recombinase/integrase [Streptomyces sp. BE133]MEE1806960.1 tyrosine-type recombinase/integrase [Streptomyces sp. BE133]